ncbi:MULTISPECIES: hypothetical protein [unclassified Microcoleus]|uniref:hypothetical protein n=1 Tax=unclassified Microcoleus TaxID=2642155 RepID=UPI002FD25566
MSSILPYLVLAMKCTPTFNNLLGFSGRAGSRFRPIAVELRRLQQPSPADLLKQKKNAGDRSFPSFRFAMSDLHVLLKTIIARGGQLNYSYAPSQPSP